MNILRNSEQEKMDIEEKRAKARAYYQANREKVLRKQKEYKDRNRDKIREKAREYNREHYSSIRKYEEEHKDKRLEINKRHYEKHKLDRQKNKVEAIKYKGCKCEHCGIEYNGTNACIFDFHHLDTSLKDTEVSIMLNSPLFSDKIKEELDKCIILCSNCHRIEHNKEY